MLMDTPGQPQLHRQKRRRANRVRFTLRGSSTFVIISMYPPDAIFASNLRGITILSTGQESGLSHEQK
jgi:hypothetical protein